VADIEGDKDVPLPGKFPTSATVLTGAAAAAGAAAVAARNKLETAAPDLPDVSLKAPKVSVPEVDVKAPEIKLPEVDVKAPEVDLPDMPLATPAVDLPDVSVSAHDVSVETDESSNLWDLAKGAVIAGGAGLAAKAASAMDFSSIDPHKPIIDPPDFDVSLPEVSLATPSLDVALDLPDADMDVPDVSLPEVSLSALETDIGLPDIGVSATTLNFSSIDPHKPIIDPPDLDVGLPEVSMSAPSLDVGLPDVEVKALEIDLPDVSMQTPDVSVEAGEGSNLWDLAKGAVIAGGAGLAAKAASAMDFSGIDPHKPIIDPLDPDIVCAEACFAAPQIGSYMPEIALAAPDVGVALPDTDMAVPEVGLPEVSLSALETDIGLPDIGVSTTALNFSAIDPHKPIIDPPDIDVSLPEVSLATPSLDVDLPDVEVTAPEVDLPEVSLPVADVELPEVSMQAADVSMDASDGSDGLWDLATGAAVAAGAGLVAKAASAGEVTQESIAAIGETVQDAVAVSDDELVDSDDETDWLLLVVQRVKEEYQGFNPRVVSKLWDLDSGYDCSALERYESLTLEPAHYDKLGSIHCGVPRAGFVAVGGDVSNIQQGAAILFHYPNIVVCRDADDNHHFIRVSVAD
jgi:hypothetical protein